MEYILAFILSLLTGTGISAVVKHRLKHSSFGQIHFQIGAICTILLFSFSTFALVGINLWSVILIPLISLLFIFFFVRKAVARLLEIH